MIATNMSGMLARSIALSSSSDCKGSLRSQYNNYMLYNWAFKYSLAVVDGREHC